MSARSLEQNPGLLCVFHALQMALFPMAVISLIWTREFGLSMTQIMGLQAWFGAVVAALEFPSGYLADRIGYRRSLSLAAGLGVAGWAVYASASSLWGAALAELALGAAFSLVSGADTALMYESLRASGSESRFAVWTGRMRGAGQLAEGSAALLAGALFAWHPRAPLILEIGAWVLAWGVTLRLVEPRRERPAHGPARRQIGRILAHAAHEPQLRAVIFLMVCLGLASFVPVWVIQIYATDAGVSVEWLGPIWALANFSVAIGSLASARVGAALGLMPTLALCIGLIAAGYAGLGCTQAWFGFAFYYCLTAMRGLVFPVLHHEEQRRIPSSDRAALVSLRSLLFRASFVGIGPAVGVGIDRAGHHTALLATGFGIVAASLAGWCWLSRVRRELP